MPSKESLLKNNKRGKKNIEAEKEKALARMRALEDQVWMLVQEPKYLEILMKLKDGDTESDEDFVVMLCASLIYGQLVKRSVEDEDLDEMIET